MDPYSTLALDESARLRAVQLAGRTGTTVVAATHDRGLLPRFQRVIDFTTLRGGADHEPGPADGGGASHAGRDAGSLAAGGTRPLDGTGRAGEPLTA